MNGFLKAKRIIWIPLVTTLISCSVIRHESWEGQEQNLSGYVEILKVNTEPTGCRIYCDEELVGESPCEIQVRYTLLGKEAYWQKQKVTPNFWVSVGPPTIERIDGGSYGATVTSTKPSSHTVTAILDGYQKTSRIVSLNHNSERLLAVVKEHNGCVTIEDWPNEFNGPRQTILLTLEPLVNPVVEEKPEAQQQQQQQQQQTVVIGEKGAKRGSVSVVCNVESAEIHVDGIFVGNSPATLKLSEGVHIIEVKMSGYDSYRKEIRVLADSSATLKAELKKK